MKMIILAAGQGTRLRPLTNNMPKCLVPLNGKPLLAWQIERARHFGINNILVVTGFRATDLVSYDVLRVHNAKFKSTNMVYSLACAIDNINEDVIISYGDIYYEDFVLEKLLISKDTFSVVVDKQWLPYWQNRFSEPLSDAESLTMDEQGHILTVGQKVLELNNIQAQYIGLMKFQKEGIDILKDYIKNLQKTDYKRSESMYMTDLLQDLVNQGHPIKAVPINRGWYEIDSISDINIAEEILSQEKVEVVL